MSENIDMWWPFELNSGCAAAETWHSKAHRLNLKLVFLRQGIIPLYIFLVHLFLLHLKPP